MIAQRHRRPCVVAGFDPSQVLAGLAEILRQLVDDQPRACTVYPSVSAEGNREAMRILDEVFCLSDAAWRAMGVISQSGLEWARTVREVRRGQTVRPAGDALVRASRLPVRRRNLRAVLSV